MTRKDMYFSLGREAIRSSNLAARILGWVYGPLLIVSVATSLLFPYETVMHALVAAVLAISIPTAGFFCFYLVRSHRRLWDAQDVLAKFMAEAGVADPSAVDTSTALNGNGGFFYFGRTKALSGDRLVHCELVFERGDVLLRPVGNSKSPIAVL